MNLIFYHKSAELKARANNLKMGIMSEMNVAYVFNNFVAAIPSEVYAQNARRWPLLPSTSVSNLSQIITWYMMRMSVAGAWIDNIGK